MVQDGPGKDDEETGLFLILKLKDQLVVPNHAELGARDSFYIAPVILQCGNFDTQLLILRFKLADLADQLTSLVGQLQHVQDATVAKQGETENQGHQSQRP